MTQEFMRIRAVLPSRVSDLTQEEYDALLEVIRTGCVLEAVAYGTPYDLSNVHKAHSAALANLRGDK